jgi:hypothetical protein
MFESNTGLPAIIKALSPEHGVAALDIVDAFHSEAALRLASRLVRAIAARRAFFEMEHGTRHAREHAGNQRPDFPLINMIIARLKKIEDLYPECKDCTKLHGFRLTLVFMNWLRMLIMQNWNGDAVVNRWGTIGAATEIMANIGVLLALFLAWHLTRTLYKKTNRFQRLIQLIYA